MDISRWTCFIQATFISGFDATIPILVSRTFGWNSLAAGLHFSRPDHSHMYIPHWLVGLATKMYRVATPLLDNIFSTAPLILLRLVDHDSIGQKMLLGSLLAKFGAPGTQFEIPMWAGVVKCTEIRVAANPRQNSADGAVGQALGLLNFFYAVGVTVGSLLSGFIYEAAGWCTMVLVLEISSAISTIPTCLCTGGYVWKKQNIQPHSVMEIIDYHGKASRG
jgi:hypothetical protein